MKTADEIEIELIDIIKIQNWYMDIFYQEDDDYPNYRIISQKNRHIQRILNRISENKEVQNEIYDTIIHKTWNNEDMTFKPICNALRNLGYKIINTYEEKQREKKKKYYQEHKKERIEYQKEWAKNNKQKVLKNNRNYKNIHKEELSKKNKEYYENNKEKILEQQKDYRKRQRIRRCFK